MALRLSGLQNSSQYTDIANLVGRIRRSRHPAQYYRSLTQIRISPSPRLAQLNHGMNVSVCGWRDDGALS